MNSKDQTRVSPGEAPKTINPLVILLGILLFAMGMTYFIQSGSYQRDGKLVIPGSYEVIEKQISPVDLLRTNSVQEEKGVHPVSLIATAEAIPKGFEKTADLIFMVLIIGGMFGILRHSGAIDAGLERLLGLLRGNIYILIPVLMMVISAGSTFLGLASEYLLIIPIMVSMANRLGMSNVMGLAIVTVAVKAGYLSSVTNPIPLSIAQPLVGLQVFSGAQMRFMFYLVFISIGIAFVLFMMRRDKTIVSTPLVLSTEKLSHRHRGILLSLAAGIGFLVYGANQWHWNHQELTAYYIGLSIGFAVLAGNGASEAARAFVDGMKKVLLASMLIGVASAVAVVLEEGAILDSIVYGLTSLIAENQPYLSVIGMFFSQLLLDFLIPSTSGQAAISMPIMGPIGQLSGVSAQSTVLAFLFGNGITNMLTPTSGTLLAYLATAQVSWARWFKFIFPLWLIFIGVALLLLGVATVTGF
ncbi:YfcC family protein [Paremcibacter congregatus]|uniref:YfcC family protein n=1 Tax=Paremcibacter congregatus TaxID=2043170 RepID=UPI003A93E7A2|tara:strand:- start:5884 stop:7296 length:1413 start_codon:yes stop_codon:yes gene_type:complete